ncbi:hypothetical protein AVEN_272999-1 [Araneus ventricosus]|uniref:Uncharacterized protein n=1 Tax=Araneus ventricosus TaxID=182803 RepID=A0A4Y2EXC3_ARAVE|nr:hypothetical protein AVEN_272999-1 [Araneus ventricosus]
MDDLSNKPPSTHKQNGTTPRLHHNQRRPAQIRSSRLIILLASTSDSVPTSNKISVLYQLSPKAIPCYNSHRQSDQHSSLPRLNITSS